MPRHRRPPQHGIRTILVSIPLALTLLVPAAVAPAATFAATCPQGWKAVTDSVTPVTLFCHKKIANLFPEGYFIKVPAQGLGQWLIEPNTNCTQLAGSASVPNPEAKKMTVHDWLATQRACGWPLGIMINGTFFADDDDSHPTSLISYPLNSSSPGMITGYDVNPLFPRVCFGFGGLNAVPGAVPWDLTNTLWPDTQTEFFTAPPNGCYLSTYHQAVGVDPTLAIGSDRPRTYFGTSNTVNTEVCILVGGKFSPTSAASVFTTFGCTAKVQMDGGNSTQLSYWNGSTIVDAVRSYTYLMGGSRTVPHAIFIFTQ